MLIQAGGGGGEGVSVPPVQSGGPGGSLTFQGRPGLSPADRLEGEPGDSCLILMVSSMYYIYFILQIPLLLRQHPETCRNRTQKHLHSHAMAARSG